MKLEEIIEQSLSLAEQYGLEPAAERKKRRAESFCSEGGSENAETGELLEMKK